MNKLLGFYELKDSSLPTIPWKEYDESVTFDNDILWTIRTAVYRGNDLNLPRAVGVDAKEAEKFASDLYRKIRDSGIVVYYPYFIAEKSGTLNVFQDKVIIEAVKEDLWNLVTYSDREVTIFLQNNNIEYDGNRYFISDEEINELFLNAKRVKQMFRDELIEGKSILLEWSYAYKCDINKNKIGDCYLVFYEARTV